jgi:tether containing UBX domain for GLUT4
MHREVVGEQLLQTTSLKSLGLTSGSAMLRVLIRDADALKTQAHVEDLKLKKPAAGSSKTEEVVADVKQNVSKFGKSLKKMVSGVIDSVTAPASQPVVEKKSVIPKETPRPPPPKAQASVDKPPVAAVAADPPPGECMDIKWLGERDALVFNLTDMSKWRSSAKQEDVSDDFFEHTQDDILLMYNDLKQRVRDMDSRPLETSALREKKQNQTRYSKTVLRICFPSDGLVIQATFLPNDSIETVMNFIRKYIRDQKKEFYLYTTPPKQVLTPADILVQKHLVPAANIHFGHSDANDPVLVPQLKSQTTSFYAIAAATAELRRQISVRKQEVDATTSDQETGAAAAAAPGPQVETDSSVSQEQKVPKWFKKA